MIKVVQRVNLVGDNQWYRHKVQSNWLSGSMMRNVSGVVSHKNNISPESHTVSNKVNVILKFRKKNVACEK